ncbi:sigma-70 family RNA polymerase sigma factor [Streptomyces sp. NPDC049916]|uniref:sigma-70 family RNA polymerase sigma factor n=1 Tax=Streptomyces sp. NPDC049916 TaxID=3155156 RepID=UPI003438DC94
MSGERNGEPHPRDAVALSRQQWLAHRTEILHYTSSLLGGDIHTAEDITQETAIRLWLHPDAHKPGRSLSPWLRTVARRILVDRHRRVRSRPAEVALATELDLEAPQATVSGLLDGHRAFEAVESQMIVDDMLACLSPKHRDAVVAVYVQGHNVKDVAVMLGIPVGTVKSRCHTAIRQLREAFRADPACCLTA